MERAIVIYTFDSTSHDELKVNKNDILDIVGKNGDWWTLRDKNGRTGLVPVNYLAAPIDDNSTKVVSRGKTTKKHNGSSETEISVNAGEQVAILDKSDTYWWLVGWQGKAGYIPKKIINEFQSRKPQEKKENKFDFSAMTPSKALCEDEIPILCSFKKPLPSEGQYFVTFKGSHLEKTVVGEFLNEFTLKVTSPVYFPAEKTTITIKHQAKDSSLKIIVNGIDFKFESKIDVVQQILKSESDPVNFLCSSFKVRDLNSVDNILSSHVEKRVPDGVDLLKNTKSALVNQEDLPNETPTLLHFAAFYDMKKLAKSLLRCPGALEAMSIKNSNGDMPISVANRKNHIEMGKLLESHQANNDTQNEDGEDIYESMESCYQRYIIMDGRNQPDDYVVCTDSFNESDELYEDMNGSSPPEGEAVYDTPRSDDRVVGDSDYFDSNQNRVGRMRPSVMQRNVDEYRALGRMSEKEVQLALLMKRVKEQYITQEQALEMAKVLHLEPEVGLNSKRNGNKPPVAPRNSLPRTMSTSSGSSVSSCGSTGSGYASDPVDKPSVPRTRPKPGFNYLAGGVPVLRNTSQQGPAPQNSRPPTIPPHSHRRR